MRQQGQLEDSLRQHEAHLQLAEEGDRAGEADTAHQHLVQVWAALLHRIMSVLFR